MRILVSLFLLFCGQIHAQSASSKQTILQRVPSPKTIRGAALLTSGELLTWGAGLQAWTVPTLRRRSLAEGDFGEGGCLVDLDGDGRQEFVGNEGATSGRLTWRQPPFQTPALIDDEFDTHDCIEATLFGRKGILVVQKRMQVRFYERSEKSPWRHREIYSIYTPSQQTGLSLRDIDGDGRTDIVCGNYWIRSPKQFDLPWRIFAINTWFEEPLSATLAHAFAGDILFAAQTHLSDARAAFFRRPANIELLWTEQRLKIALHRVHAVTAVEGAVFIAENNGVSSRTFVLRNDTPELVLQGMDTLALVPVKDAIVSVGPRELAVWRYRRR